MIKLFNKEIDISWVIFPDKYMELKNNKYDFLPWYLVDDEDIKFWTKYLFDTYKRNLFPIARRDASDDFACWEKGQGNKIQIIHTFTDAGWEQREIFDDFEQWYQWALQYKYN